LIRRNILKTPEIKRRLS